MRSSLSTRMLIGAFFIMTLMGAVCSGGNVEGTYPRGFDCIGGAAPTTDSRLALVYMKCGYPSASERSVFAHELALDRLTDVDVTGARFESFVATVSGQDIALRLFGVSDPSNLTERATEAFTGSEVDSDEDGDNLEEDGDNLEGEENVEFFFLASINSPSQTEDGISGTIRWDGVSGDGFCRNGCSYDWSVSRVTATVATVSRSAVSVSNFAAGASLDDGITRQFIRLYSLGGQPSGATANETRVISEMTVGESGNVPPVLDSRVSQFGDIRVEEDSDSNVIVLARVGDELSLSRVEPWPGIDLTFSMAGAGGGAGGGGAGGGGLSGTPDRPEVIIPAGQTEVSVQLRVDDAVLVNGNSPTVVINGGAPEAWPTGSSAITISLTEGLYNIVVNDDAGRIETADLRVIASGTTPARVEIIPDPDAPISDGESVALNVNGPNSADYSYQWFDGGATPFETRRDIDPVTPSVTTTYRVELLNGTDTLVDFDEHTVVVQTMIDVQAGLTGEAAMSGFVQMTQIVDAVEQWTQDCRDLSCGPYPRPNEGTMVFEAKFRFDGSVRFAGWSGDCSVGGDANRVELDANADLQCTAAFERIGCSATPVAGILPGDDNAILHLEYLAGQVRLDASGSMNVDGRTAQWDLFELPDTTTPFANGQGTEWPLLPSGPGMVLLQQNRTYRAELSYAGCDVPPAVYEFSVQ